MSEWRAIRVTISLGDQPPGETSVFDAYTGGNTWNGWVVPFFTEAEGRRIATWTKQLKETLPSADVESVEWHEGSRSFVMEDPQYPGEPEVVEEFYNEENGEPFYGIGAYKWSWEPAEAVTESTH